MKPACACLAALALLSSSCRQKEELDLDSFGEALESASRSADIKAEEDLYAPLVGVWEVDTLDRQPNGTFAKGHGEWLFSRTLEGRAFQDVWIMPRRQKDGPRPDHIYNRYGTTVRMMNPKTRKWQITWFNPKSGAFDTLYARKEGTNIVQEGTRPDGQRVRWIFDRLQKDHFHWYGESEQPDGSWRREVEFNGIRRAGTRK
jgi:hypothetical protein